MPPDAVTVCEYVELIVPLGRLDGDSEITGQICSVTAWEPVQPFASVVRKVTLVPLPFAVVAEPLMTPLLAFNVRPAGSVPLVTVHEP